MTLVVVCKKICKYRRVKFQGLRYAMLGREPALIEMLNMFSYFYHIWNMPVSFYHCSFELDINMEYSRQTSGGEKLKTRREGGHGRFCKECKISPGPYKLSDFFYVLVLTASM